MKNEKIYRKEALKKLSQPEELDVALPVTKPFYWYAVIGGLIVLVALCIWAFNGYINTTTSGSSVFYTKGYTCSYSSEQSGLITDVLKGPESFVKKGEPILDYIDSDSNTKKAITSPVTGLIIKNDAPIGSYIYEGMDLFTIRAFTVEDNGLEVLYDSKPELLNNPSYSDFEKRIYICVSLKEISKIDIGDDVVINSSYTARNKPIHGYISKINPYLMTDNDIKSLVGMDVNEGIRNIMKQSILCECTVNDEYMEDISMFHEGDNVYSSINTGRVHPINLLFNNLVSD